MAQGENKNKKSKLVVENVEHCKKVWEREHRTDCRNYTEKKESKRIRMRR